MARRIGVDVGGTGVRAAAIGEDGAMGPVVRLPLADRRVATVVDAVAAAVEGAGGADRAGVGVPGFVRQGVVLGSPNFPEWRDVPLKASLEARLSVPVTVENDANAAALGCWALRGRREDLVLLTLGTGVGGGVVTEGRLLRGAGGTGAELGHIHVGGDRRCGCGGIGCLETWVSNGGIVKGAADRGEVVQDAAAVVARAEAGEAWAQDVVREAGEALGKGLVTFVNLFNPDVVVISGGLTAAEHLLRPPSDAWLRRYGIRPSVEWCSIVWEGRADPFAITGAAFAAG
jgi:glucokinase